MAYPELRTAWLGAEQGPNPGEKLGAASIKLCDLGQAPESSRAQLTAENRGHWTVWLVESLDLHISRGEVQQRLV